jgi:hypothetical protein
VYYDISQVPLIFDNTGINRQYKINARISYVVLAIYGLIRLAGLAAKHSHGDPIKFSNNFRLELVIVFLIVVLVEVFQFTRGPDKTGMSAAKKGKLTIDESGIRISLEDGIERNYPWQDIQSVRTNTLTPKILFSDPEKVIQIRRKGQIQLDQYDDVIDGSFGIPVSELKTLIESGIQKWGGVPETT